MLRHVHCSERYSRRLEHRLYASALRAGCRCAEFISPAGSESSSDISPCRFIRLTLGQKVRTVNYVVLTECCSDNSRSAPAVKLRISPSAAYYGCNVFAGRVQPIIGAENNWYTYTETVDIKGILC